MNFDQTIQTAESNVEKAFEFQQQLIEAQQEWTNAYFDTVEKSTEKMEERMEEFQVE